MEESEDIESLSVSNLLRIDEEIKKPLKFGYRRRRNLQLTMYFAGLLYVVFGIIFVMAFKGSALYINDGIRVVAYVFIYLGIIMLFLSFFIENNKILSKNYRKKDIEYNRKVLEYNIVSKWREVEGLVTDNYSDSKRINTNSIISGLLADNYINKKEAEKLRKLLKMRNEIVHNVDNNISLEELNNTLKDVDEIIKNLKENI